MKSRHPVPLAEYAPEAFKFLQDALDPNRKIGRSVLTLASEGKRTTLHIPLFALQMREGVTVMFDEQAYRDGPSRHVEMSQISRGGVVLGNYLYTGGTNPHKYDAEEEGHNGKRVVAMEALKPDGTQADRSVRVGAALDALGGLLVVPDLSVLADSGYTIFDPEFHENATSQPLQR